MIRESLLKQILLLVAVIVVLHFSAIALYLYWSFWWYDLVLHFLGGVFLSLLSLWILFFSGYVNLRAKSPWEIVAAAFICTLSIGFLWELFEFLAGAIASPEGYFADTVVDLIMDAAGSLAGYLYFFFMKYERTLLQ